VLFYMSDCVGVLYEKKVYVNSYSMFTVIASVMTSVTLWLLENDSRARDREGGLRYAWLMWMRVSSLSRMPQRYKWLVGGREVFLSLEWAFVTNWASRSCCKS
jgi:hypothetical protein